MHNRRGVARGSRARKTIFHTKVKSERYSLRTSPRIIKRTLLLFSQWIAYLQLQIFNFFRTCSTKNTINMYFRYTYVVCLFISNIQWPSLKMPHYKLATVQHLWLSNIIITHNMSEEVHTACLGTYIQITRMCMFNGCTYIMHVCGCSFIQIPRTTVPPRGSCTMSISLPAVHDLHSDIHTYACTSTIIGN